MTKCSQIGLFPSLCRTVIAAHEPICRLPADSAPACSEPARRAASSPDTAHGLRGRAWEPLGVQGGADTTARPGQTGLNRSLTEPGGGRRPEQGGGQPPTARGLSQPFCKCAYRGPDPGVLARVKRHHPCEGLEASLSPGAETPSPTKPGCAIFMGTAAVQSGFVSPPV